MHPNDVIDFGEPVSRAAIDTTIQELTGDWNGYRIRRLSASPSLPIGGLRTHAPTQELGAWFATHLTRDYRGFLSPSARNPLVQNLVLFYDHLPNGSVIVTGRSRVTV